MLFISYITPLLKNMWPERVIDMLVTSRNDFKTNDLIEAFGIAPEKILQLVSSVIITKKILDQDGLPDVITFEIVDKPFIKELRDRINNISSAILVETAGYFRTTTDRLRSSQRDEENVVMARKIVIYILHNKLKLSHRCIATLLGHKGHSAVSRAINATEPLIMEEDEGFYKGLNDILARCFLSQT